jgi:hypothetical protein
VISYSLIVTYAQGYHFFHPLNVNRVIELLGPSKENQPTAPEPLTTLELPFAGVQSLAVN